MNTNRTGMRTVLAAAAAGALILGSAGGAMAAKPDTKPAPQTTVKLQSVSIKGHKTIDVGVLPAATVKLRATIWDPANKYTSTETVTLQLAAFTKKVKGDPVAAVTPFDAPARQDDQEDRQVLGQRDLDPDDD
jgi:hypothetical protein